MKRTNKIFALLLAVLMVALMIPFSALTAFAADEVPVTGVNYTMSYAEIPTGKAIGFTADVLPENATNKKITYTSSDYSVAVVDPSTGNITGMKAGTAIITATSQDGNFTDTVEVKVIDGLGETNTVIFYGESTTSPYETQTIGIGNKAHRPAVAPTKEGHVFCGWYTSWECVAPWDFDEDTVSSGLIMIYAKWVAEADYVAVSGISLSTNSFTYDLKNDTIYPLTAKVAPDNASVTPIIIWSVSEPSVVEITENSSNQIYFKGLKPGTATITATTKDGAYSASCVVTVTDSRSISLQGTASFDLAYVTGVTLSATVEPSDTTNKELVWTVDDPSILEIKVVDNDTVILNGLKEGVATVTVSTKDGMQTASCEVTVTDSRSISLQGTASMDLADSNTLSLSATLETNDTSNDALTWTVDDPSVLEIQSVNNDTVILKGLKEGVATVTVSTKDGAKSASCVVTVIDTLIESLEIYITPPIAGQTPATTATTNNPHVKVTSVVWDTDDTTFVEGKRYFVVITVETDEGYMFHHGQYIITNRENFKINGTTAMSFYGELDELNKMQTLGFEHKFTASPPHTHTYTNSVIKTDADYHWLECDAADCPDKLGSIKDKVEHSASTPATCVAKATCVCGQEFGDFGTHTFATDAWNEEVPATCVATGTKAHKDCSVCHKHFAADGVTEITDLTIAIDTTNHDMATEWSKNAGGHYRVCKRTGCEYHETLTTHTPDKAVATETESVNCSVCGYVITPALGATPDTEPGTEPGTTPGTDDPNTPDDPTDDDKDGLGAGAIVGIVIGAVVVLGGGGFALYWFVLKKKPTDPTDPTTLVEEAPDADTDEAAEATDEDGSPETEDAPETEDKKDTE